MNTSLFQANQRVRGHSKYEKEVTGRLLTGLLECVRLEDTAQAAQHTPIHTCTEYEC